MHVIARQGHIGQRTAVLADVLPGCQDFPADETLWESNHVLVVDQLFYNPGIGRMRVEIGISLYHITGQINARPRSPCDAFRRLADAHDVCGLCREGMRSAPVSGIEGIPCIFCTDKMLAVAFKFHGHGNAGRRRIAFPGIKHDVHKFCIRGNL